MLTSFKIKLTVLILFLVVAFSLGIVIGKIITKDMPSVRNLDNYFPPIMTRVFSASGEEIFRFGEEKRILIDQKSVPPFLANAITATEDSRFYRHSGVDFKGILRAAVHNVRSMDRAQGGSTLTQQLARNLFLKPDKTFKRKIQEAILALQIERSYTKEEILHFYCNQIYMGHGRFGIEAASLYYFGKSSGNLLPAEYAMLAGIIQRPEGNSPLRNPSRANTRKNHVIDRMVSEGFLKREEAERIKEEKIRIVGTGHEESNIAPYFVEEVRKSLLSKYGDEVLYRQGLDVYTTLDPQFQQYANEAIKKGLEELQQRHPRKTPAEAALIAIDPFTGEIKALVGGSDFSKSEWNRAVQAPRQPGSAFKPFILAAALENGLSPSFNLLDEPIIVYDSKTDNPYQPDNYTGDYSGLRTIRLMIEQSINIPTVKLLNLIGYDKVIKQARKMGLQANLQPYPSMALGSFEATLLNITSAYSALPNGGIRIEPYFVRQVVDRTGVVREEAKKIGHESISEESAFQMIWVLKGVVESGTAQKAASLGIPLAGKTGTTNDCTDAWFIGFSPDLVCGVWVGYDQKRTLGHDETGARAALPIWIDFMSKACSTDSERPFTMPPGISLVPVDKKTGMRAGVDTGCDEVVLEAFKKGEEPLGRCSQAWHFRASLPYQILRFPFSEKNELIVTQNDLRDIISQDPTIRYSKGSKKIEVTVEGKTVSIPIVITDKKAEIDIELSESRAGYCYEVDGKRWFGSDGRLATVIPVNEGSQSIEPE